MEDVVELVPRFAASGTDSMFHFFTGAIDVGYVGITPFLLGCSYGLPVTVIGVAQRIRSTDALVLSRDADTSHVKIGTVFGSTGHMVAADWAKRGGYQVSFVNLSPPDQLKAFTFGFVDGLGSWQPYPSAAEEAGGVVAHRADDLDVPVLNLIVAREDIVTRAGGTLRRFLAAHDDGARIIQSGLPHEELSKLASVFDAGGREAMLAAAFATGFAWPSTAAVDADTHDVAEALEGAQRFLIDQHLTSVELDGVGSFITAADAMGGDSTDRLVVGYSDDLMCAPFHVARLREAFDAHGFAIQRDEVRLVERIATLDPGDQQALATVQRVLDVDPELATLKIGRMNEQLFHTVHRRCYGGPPPKSLAATLERLTKDDIVPAIVATSAHWIRSIRNVAAHDRGVDRGQAWKAFEHVVDVLEWHQRYGEDLGRRCLRCSRALSDDWRSCPHCGLDLAPTCGSCGAGVEPAWTTCPFCTTSLAG